MKEAVSEPEADSPAAKEKVRYPIYFLRSTALVYSYLLEVYLLRGDSYRVIPAPPYFKVPS